MPYKSFVFIVIITFVLSIFSTVAFLIGGLIAEQNCYSNYFESRKKDVQDKLNLIDDIDGIELLRDSKGRVVLVGTVDDAKTIEKLRKEITLVIGKRDAETAVQSLFIEKRSQNKR